MHNLNFELLFLVANVSVLPVWLCMMAAPGAAFTQRLVATPAVPLVYALLYAALFVASFFTDSGGAMGSMVELRAAFESDLILLMAWVHYLCFDMVVGMWEVRDATRHGISRWLLAPCLLLTLMLGPIGFATYYLGRRFRTGQAGF